MNVVSVRHRLENPLQIGVRVDVLSEVVLRVDGVARVSSSCFFFCHAHMDVRLFIDAFILPPFCAFLRA